MKTLLLSIFIGFSFIGQTQISYTLSTFTEPYTPITGGNVLSEPGWDDAEYFGQLGFNLSIGEGIYNTYLAAGDGAFLGLLSSTNDVALFGLTSDFIDGSIIPDADPSIISATLEGEVGNRIYKFQFESVAFYNEVQGNTATSAQRMNFQYWFYEVDNAIEIRFGENTVLNPEEVFNGEQGPLIYFLVQDAVGSTVDYFAAITGEPDQPVLEDVSFGVLPALSGVPDNGRVYRLAPPPVVVSVSEAHRSSFALYPNPSQDWIYVKGLTNGMTNARIYNITGAQVWNGKLLSGNRIDVSQLGQGIYLLAVDGMSEMRKFVKQ